MSKQSGPAGPRWRALLALVEAPRYEGSLSSVGHLLQRRVECSGQPAHDLIDLLFGDDKGRRDQSGVAIGAVGMSYIGPDCDSGGDRRVGEALGKFRRARQRGAARLVLDELDSGEQTAPAHVADMRQVG